MGRLQIILVSTAFLTVGFREPGLYAKGSTVPVTLCQAKNILIIPILTHGHTYDI